MKNLLLFACSGLAFAASAAVNPSVKHIQRTMKALEESTAAKPATVRILFYGQSIVAQPWTGKLMARCWRGQALHVALAGTGPACCPGGDRPCMLPADFTAEWKLGGN